MSSILEFFALNKPYFDAAHAISSIVSLLGWCIGGVLVYVAWRRGGIGSIALGPLHFQLRQAAVDAAESAAMAWQGKSAGKNIDMTRLRSTVERALAPEIVGKLIGKSILWVDDNPANNMLVVRALKRLQLEVEEQLSTEAGLEAMQRRHFDLVISDMGRGQNMRAGYEILKAIRDRGNRVPFLIFAGSDSPEFRREAAEQGAQLSTNDMLELMDKIVDLLAK